MNKEIKFRVWDIKNGFWIDSSKFRLDLEPLFQPNFYQEFIFQQYIGIKDETGRQIFEGDIVQLFNNGSCFVGGKTEAEILYVVEYTGIGFKFNIVNGEIMNWCGVITKEPLKRIVVGNIFENPELLKFHKNIN